MATLIIIGVIVLGFFLLTRESKEDKAVRQVREIEQVKTQQLRREIATKQAAAKKAREELDKITTLEIEKIRRDFFLAPTYFVHNISKQLEGIILTKPSARFVPKKH